MNPSEISSNDDLALFLGSDSAIEGAEIQSLLFSVAPLVWEKGPRLELEILLPKNASRVSSRLLFIFENVKNIEATCFNHQNVIDSMLITPKINTDGQRVVVVEINSDHGIGLKFETAMAIVSDRA